MLLIPKYLGTAPAPYVALPGALGTAVGLVHGSGLASVTGAIDDALAAEYVRHVASLHDGLEQVFGANSRRRIPRMQSSTCSGRCGHGGGRTCPSLAGLATSPFWTIPGSDRELLADIWQPPAGVEPSGTAIVYLHGQPLVLMGASAGGHVALLAAYGANHPAITAHAAPSPDDAESFMAGS